MNGQKKELARTGEGQRLRTLLCSKLLLELEHQSPTLILLFKGMIFVLVFNSTALEILKQGCLCLDVDQKPRSFTSPHLLLYFSMQIDAEQNNNAYVVCGKNHAGLQIIIIKSKAVFF